MAQSIADSIGILYHFLTEAKNASEKSAPSRKLRDALATASSVLHMGEWTTLSADAAALTYFIDDAVNGLKVTADGFDREAGNAACRRVEGILMADLVEDPFSTTDVEKLVAEYKATTKQTGTRRSGSSSVSDLGFTVKVKDDQTGETVASTTKDNLNSLRDQLRKHHEKVHGSKPGKGDPVWEGLTSALKPVFDGKQEQASGGGYTVSKAA